MTELNPKVDIAGLFVFRLYPGSAIYARLTSKYNIHVPSDLEEWVKHLEREASFVEIPWTPKWFQRNYRLLDFYASHALGTYPQAIQTAAQAVSLLWRFFGRARFKRFFFRFPFEYWLNGLLVKTYRLAVRRSR